MSRMTATPGWRHGVVPHHPLPDPAAQAAPPIDYLKKKWHLCNIKSFHLDCFYVFLFFLKPFYLLFKDFIYFWREGKGRRKRGKETLMWERKIDRSPLPEWGPNQQPRHMCSPGIELATFHFVGWCSTNWATYVRAVFMSFNKIIYCWSHRSYSSWSHVLIVPYLLELSLASAVG